MNSLFLLIILFFCCNNSFCGCREHDHGDDCRENCSWDSRRSDSCRENRSDDNSCNTNRGQGNSCGAAFDLNNSCGCEREMKPSCPPPPMPRSAFPYMDNDSRTCGCEEQ